MFPLDLSQWVGLAGAPTVQQIVEYLKNQWRLPVYLAPLTAILFGILINEGIALVLHTDLTTALLMGTLTGFAASGWHEIQKGQ